MSKQEYINDFNTIFLDMANYIANICPSSVIGRNIKDINKAFEHLCPKNKTKFIDGYVIKVLKYKKFIDEENEEFFFKEIEKDEVKNSKELKTNEIDLYELKTIWCKLKQEDKDQIFQFLQGLCAVSQEYILLD